MVLTLLVAGKFMRILVYGAGVIGTLYAARLRQIGHDVTVLARGRRLADIRSHGLAIENLLIGDRLNVDVPTVERLSPDDNCDLALVTVRRDQLASAMPELTSNRRIPTFLFMMNMPIGSAELSRTLGKDRVMLGFPGAGGTRDGEVVRYALIPQQPMMVGELHRSQTPRLSEVQRAFRAAGFRTRVARDMDAWLKAHAFFITAISGALYLAGADSRRLAANDAALRLMVEGVREGFAAVDALGHTVTPFALKVLFTWLPRAIAVRYWAHYFATEMGDYVFARHARAAFGELRELANDCRTLLGLTRVEARALRQLYAAIDAYADAQ